MERYQKLDRTLLLEKETFVFVFSSGNVSTRAFMEG